MNMLLVSRLLWKGFGLFFMWLFKQFTWSLIRSLRNETFFARNVNLFFCRYEGKFADHYKFKFEVKLRKELKLVLMWFYNLNSLGDLSSAVLRNEIFFTREIKPFYFWSIRRQISEWNLLITWNLTGLLVNKDHLILKSGKKKKRGYHSDSFSSPTENKFKF